MLRMFSILVLVAHYVVLARLTALHLPDNATLSNFAVPVNGSHPSREPTLPGFKITLGYAPPFPMKPEDAYLCALEYMYFLASVGWDGIIPSEHTGFSKEVNEVKVGVRSNALPGDKYQLQYKHVILGLLRIVNTLASRGGFCFTKADLYLYKEHIGQMALGRRAPENLTGLSGVNATLNWINPIGSATNRRNLQAMSEIVDPEDSDFVISYEMLENQIPCQALLNAALNGMAFAAAFNDLDRCRNFASFSSSGEVTCTMIGDPSSMPRFVLSYILVRTVLKLLPAQLYETGSCGKEVGFDLTYGGEKIGGGTFLLSDFQNTDKAVVR